MTQNETNCLTIEYHTFSNTDIKNNSGTGLCLKGVNGNNSVHDLSNKIISLLDFNLKNNRDEGNPITTVLNSATILFGDYNKTLFKNSAGVLKLRYIDGSDATIITDITD